MGVVLLPDMEEADAQTAVGDAIEAATANAIAARNHKYVEKLAAGSGARGTLYTAAPAIASHILPPPRARPSDSTPARLMRGQPMSAKERHGLFQHGPREDDDASAEHYNLLYRTRK